MGSPDSIRQVAEIIKGKAGNIVAVVSATSGTTDTLLQMADAAMTNGPFEKTLDSLMLKHDKIMGALGVKVNLDGYWDEIGKLLQGVNLMNEISPSALDRLSGFGERISS